MKKEFFLILFLFVVSATLSLPLVKSGLFVIHDDQQVARLFLFDQALKTGQFPPRWVDELGFGFGYPLFVFYPPLVYMIGELFHLIGFSFIDSIKLVFFTSIFASGLAIYILAKEFWDRQTAAVSALFYILVPYRALDVYVRGALAESFSFVWLPLILWSFYKLYKTNKPIYVYLSTIFLALLMITHNLIFLPFMLILPFYLFFLILVSDNKKKFIVNCFWSIVASLGLSAFFWLPAILEKKYTIVDQLLLVNLANYNIHFVYPQQLWSSLWGFGGSAVGLADGISFKIGKLHILISVAAFMLAAAHIFKRRNISRQLLAPLKSQHEPSTDSSEKANAKINGVNCQLSIVFFVLFLFSAFMTTFYSKPIWNLIPPLAYLQFPWRFLIFTSLFSSILAGAFLYLLRLPILRLIASLILVILLVIGNFKLFKPQTYRLDLTDEIATTKEVINWEVSGSSFEYLPKDVPLYVGELGTNLVKIKRDEIPKQKVEILSGVSTIENLKVKPSKITFDITAKEQTEVRINNFNSPGWQAQVDQARTSIDDNNKLKLVTLNVPAGIHQVKVEFKNTPIRTLGNSLTLATIIISMAFFLRPKWRKIRSNNS
ncbi:hypothetical protein A3H83_00330 [Candidatus Roizmanbacteria bacterium RIFCSPLOWO2_02_FULL_39_8]|nr:MAG: hypothetical protein A3H83_00330 [Candidatus Roizmanbacteria bacterium RIFCSPLOWO2_02_FULL_39_8]